MFNVRSLLNINIRALEQSLIKLKKTRLELNNAIINKEYILKMKRTKLRNLANVWLFIT